MVYLLHFDRPYRHARHYLGYARDVDGRIERHRSGDGARLIQVIIAAGIGFSLVRQWDGGRDVERKLKNRKNTPGLCPLCNPNWQQHGVTDAPTVPHAAVHRRGRRRAVQGVAF